ncbi:MAG TPA: ABC-2 family transporter protein [Symbiobacteriaceae bacterium]|nr:ABC-2 family transporter protein [Symbiobacteriaceae bacterium]
MTYVELVRIRFLTMLAYRLNYFSGILTYVVYTGGYYFLWKAVYGGREVLGSMTAAQMTTYLAVSWMTRSFYFNNLDREIADEIRSGAVAIQLIRPYSYLLGKLTGAFGEGLFRLCFWMVPGMLAAVWLFPVALPGRLSTYLMWALAGLLAFLVNALLNVLFGLATFFLHNAQGLQWARQLATDLLSGLFLPLHLYPGWMQAAIRWLPFQTISYLPNMIFTGGLTGSAAWQAVGLQVTWVVVLALLTGLLWGRARRYLVVQGG